MLYPLGKRDTIAELEITCKLNYDINFPTERESYLITRKRQQSQIVNSLDRELTCLLNGGTKRKNNRLIVTLLDAGINCLLLVDY